MPGVAPGAGVRSLTLANPNDLQATVSLTVNGPNGPFKPNNLSTVQVPAGSVMSVRLDAAVQGDASGITVNSDQPITAAVAQRRQVRYRVRLGRIGRNPQRAGVPGAAAA